MSIGWKWVVFNDFINFGGEARPVRFVVVGVGSSVLDVAKFGFSVKGDYDGKVVRCKGMDGFPSGSSM